jgi:hypothetical protein
MTTRFSFFVPTLSHSVPTYRGDRKTALVILKSQFFMCCPYCPYHFYIKEQIKRKMVKTIELYVYRRNNIEKVGTVGTVEPQK